MADIKDLVIAELDNDANEVETLDVDGFPTLMLYSKNYKQGLAYPGNAVGDDLDKIKEWLYDHSPAWQTHK